MGTSLQQILEEFVDRKAFGNVKDIQVTERSEVACGCYWAYNKLIRTSQCTLIEVLHKPHIHIYIYIILYI